MKSLLFIIPLFLIAMAAHANSGFYQGAGSTMVPVQNKYLRVVKENLLITPLVSKKCYPLLYKEETIRDIKTRFSKAIGEYDFAVLGKPFPCSQWERNLLEPLWHVQAEYEVEAFQDQENITMGFPIPIWDAEFTDSEGLQDITAPGVVNFETFLNDKQIVKTQLNWIQEPDIKVDNVKGKCLAYIWRVSFKKGTKYKLKTEYDFGGIDSNSYYEEVGNQTGKPPWFLPTLSGGETFQTIKYFLTPIKLWAAPPPEKISIKIVLPEDVAAVYAIPFYPKPKCVDVHSLYYEFNDQFPEKDLVLTLPWSTRWQKFKFESMQNLDQFAMWQAWIGGENILISCALAKKIESGTKDVELKKKIKVITCTFCLQ